MIRRFAPLALALALILGSAAQAATKPGYSGYPKGAKPRAAAPLPAPQPLPDLVRVAMVTELGTIELELDHKRAPVTVQNFMRYVQLRRFDGIVFYRAMHVAWGDQPNGLVQAGLQNHPQKILKPIAHEPTSQTGLSHTRGAISMARYAPGTATADFSIMLGDMTGLDANPKSDNPEFQAGFAAFGKVVSGMDVVEKIWGAPRSATKGEGVMKGQMLDPTIKVLTVRRVEAAATRVAAPLPAQ